MMNAFHGSDLEKIEELYGIRKEEIISFSANVNPLGISDHFKKSMEGELDCIEHYPDREYTSLREAIAGYCKADPSDIIVGNGSSELIGSVIRHKIKPKTLIVAPAYSEYERNVMLCGGEACYFDLKEEEDFRLDTGDLIKRLEKGLDLVMICSPSNPTSYAVRKDDLRRILDRCEALNITCAVDETYMDFADDEYDITPLTGEYRCLFVIRSFSKFFCAPGLRLGYAVCHDEKMKQQIREHMDPWSVSSFAAKAGEVLVADTDFIERSRRYIREERDRICHILDDMRSLGLKYYDPKGNFILLRLPKDKMDSKEFFERAIREKMFIRDCSTFRGLDERFARFCIMKREDNDALMSLLREGID